MATTLMLAVDAAQHAWRVPAMLTGARKRILGRAGQGAAALVLATVVARPTIAGEPAVAGVDDGFSALIARCAPTVHPETMSAVISAESRGNQFAIADAGPVALPWSQRKTMVRSFYMGTLDESVAKATELIAAGHTVSLGLAQVNDRNLARYGLTVRDVFDPCTNVSVGGKILTDFYVRAVAKFGANQRALHAAISAYNSGDWVRGAKDGYVTTVYRQVGRPLAMKNATPSSSPPKALAAVRPAPFRGVKGTSTIPYGAPPRAFLMVSGDFTSGNSFPE